MCVGGYGGGIELPQGNGPSRYMNGKGIVPDVPLDVGWHPRIGRLSNDDSWFHLRHWHITHGHGGRRKHSLLQGKLCIYIVNELFPAGNIESYRMSGHSERASKVHFSKVGFHCSGCA